MPDAADFKRRKHARRRDAIAINFAGRGKASMKIMLNESTAHHSNLRGKMSIECGAQDYRSERGCEINMRALAYRVHTGIGPTGSVHAAFFPSDTRESCL